VNFVKRMEQLALMARFRNCFMFCGFLLTLNYLRMQLLGDILSTNSVLITCKQVQLDNLTAGNFTQTYFSTKGLKYPENNSVAGIFLP